MLLKWSHCMSPWCLQMFALWSHNITLGVFDWAVPNVSILLYARFFIRLVPRTNGSESSERTNVRALRVAKTAQITWHTKSGQRGLRFDFSGQRGSRFVLSIRLSMYHNLTSIFSVINAVMKPKCGLGWEIITFLLWCCRYLWKYS